MIEDYYIYQTDIEKKYGPDSTIFMMVGSFYEIYEFEDVGKAKTISPLLNLSLTKRNKNIEQSKTNPWMCGFPAHCVKKYLDILTKQYQYTVGIVDQFDVESSNKKQRELCKIYSPCMPYEDEDDNEDNYCMIMNIQKQRKNHLSKDERFFFTFILFNLSSGRLYYNENDYENEMDIKKDVLKMICEYRMKEIIWIESGYIFELDQNIKVHNYDKMDSKYRVLDYQQKVLSRIYHSEEKDVISDIDLERHPIIVEYLVFLFDFIYDHSPLLLSRIQKPELYFYNDNMYYHIHTYYELNMINSSIIRNKKIKHSDRSLLDILDQTITKMGSRYLYHLIFKPTHNVQELIRRYDDISYYLSHEDERIFIRKQLSNICDVEKKIRKQPFHPVDMYHIINSVEYIRTIIPDIDPSFLDECKRIWDVEKMNTNYEQIFYYAFQTSPKTLHLEKNINVLNDFVKKYDICQLKLSNDDVYLIVNKKKWKQMSDKPSEITTSDLTTQLYKLHSPKLDKIYNEIIILRNEIKNNLSEQFRIDIKRILDTYSELFKDIISRIKKIDVMTTFAHISKKYKYIRPTIIDNPVSSVCGKGIRHPIIEQINDNEVFVTNDLDLSDQTYGNLIYGLNSAGKSTFLKSIGLQVIMAQIGMFVPADEFILSPFRSMYSKIFVMDDIYKGYSTFIYELNELKFMMNHSDHHSIILCDELTSGTETWSATGILVSTILSFIEMKSRFIMTSHLHTLGDFPEITQNPHLNIFHFNVSVSPSLIFHRKLLPGMGDSLYGIEIAGSMSFPEEFIKRAYDFRNKIAKKHTKLCSEKRSRYNKKLIMDKCSNCGVKEGLHTHHIKPQKEGDENGFIGHFHKNKLFNLQVLCEKCHNDYHHYKP